MVKKAKPKGLLEGRWLINSMDQWDLDSDDEGYFEFGHNNSGSFAFASVRGNIDYRTGIRDGKPCVEFSWDGHDESDPAQGRGWAILDGNRIQGMIFFHEGDESEFVAEKAKCK